jgi:hypothetical protein
LVTSRHPCGRTTGKANQRPSPPSRRRGPAALANDAGGRRGQASSSGSGGGHRCHARASLVLAGRALRVSVAPIPDGDPRTTAVGREGRLSCAIAGASWLSGVPGRAFQARDRRGHTGATSGPQSAGPQRTTPVTTGSPFAQLPGTDGQASQVASTARRSLARRNAVKAWGWTPAAARPRPADRGQRMLWPSAANQLSLGQRFTRAIPAGP